MKVYILLLISLLFNMTALRAMKSEATQEFAPPVAMDIVPWEVKILILEHLIDEESLEKTLKNINNLAKVNKEFHAIINHPQNMKWLIQTIAMRVIEVTELQLFEKIKNIEAFKGEEIQAWIEQRKNQIPLEDTLSAMAAQAKLAELKALIKSGVNVNASSEELSALDFAIMSNNLEVFTELLNAGANINRQSKKYGNTPLMRAVVLQRPAIVKLLLQNKPNLKLRNKNGKTVFDFAVKSQNKEILELLQAYKNN